MASELSFHYFIRRDRSGRVRWMLEELELPFDARRLDYEAGEASSPEYLRLHPLGRVPAVTMDVGTIHESGAICLYLADRYAPGRLAPLIDDPSRALYLQWMFYGPATIDPAISGVWDSDEVPEPQRVERRKTAVDWFKRVAKVVADSVEHNPYVTGNTFTAADVVIGLPLYWARRSNLLSSLPHVLGYLDRITARTAAVRSGVFADEGTQ